MTANEQRQRLEQLISGICMAALITVVVTTIGRYSYNNSVSTSTAATAPAVFEWNLSEEKPAPAKPTEEEIMIDKVKRSTSDRHDWEIDKLLYDAVRVLAYQVNCGPIKHDIWENSYYLTIVYPEKAAEQMAQLSHDMDATGIKVACRTMGQPFRRQGMLG
jgi:hypothetical protein